MDSVRGHLADCEDCRAVVDGFETGDGNGSQSTQTDESRSPTQPAPSFGETIQVFLKRKIGGGLEYENNALHTLTDPAADPSRRSMSSLSPITASQGTPSDAPQQPHEATVCLPAGGKDSSGSFQLADPSGIASGTQSSDSSETAHFFLAAPVSQVGAGGSPINPTRADAPVGLFSGAATLQGVTVPGYDILEELGRGGMGVVYKARHRRLQRLVALKMVLAGAHVGQVGLARFRAEAEAVAKLLHPNIVQIFETGEHEGRPFFSLEYVEGGSLDQRIAKSPTSPRGAAQLVETLARTMDVAHQRGIVHRDLKPANILLARSNSQSSATRSRETDSSSLPPDHWSRDAVPKIADFGLAKRTDDDSSQTATGAILGTPSYMAPEQAGGKTREIGPAVDIYALGAILYELLVGRPPFKAGNPIDTVRQVIEQEPVPPRQLEPRVPYDLETICLKCLEKDPARRFATAAELADDLRRFVDGDPIHARPTPAWERAWKWGKRRKTTVALLGVITLAIAGGVLFVVWHNVSLRGKLDVALAEERRARQREMEALREQHLARTLNEGQKLFDSARVAAAASDWSSARVDLEKSLTTIGSEARFDALREPALALLARVQKELRVEADRRASQARLQEFVRHRDQAQFLGTLYTGMDLAANLEAVARPCSRRWLFTACSTRRRPGRASTLTWVIPRRPTSWAIAISCS